MKTFLYISAILALSSASFLGCKKSKSVTPVTPVDTTKNNPNYDISNRIFRVKASSSDVPYTVSVTTVHPGMPSAPDVQQGTQSTGAAFEYPFTPGIGDTIKIVAQSDKGSVYLYPLYKGTLLSPVNNQTKTTGGMIATFNYVVPN